MQFITGEKGEKQLLEKLIFTSGNPVVISRESGTFTMVMSTFHQYEKDVSIFVNAALTINYVWDIVRNACGIPLHPGKAWQQPP